MTTYFVTRHEGAIAWAKRNAIEAAFVKHLEVTEIAPGDTVMGTLPVNLAAQVIARGGNHIHMELIVPPSARGRELTTEEMEAIGVRLQEYIITKISRQRKAQ